MARLNMIEEELRSIQHAFDRMLLDPDTTGADWDRLAEDVTILRLELDFAEDV
jgi:hypothetical protein